MNRPIMTKRQVLSNFSVIIIQKILLGEDSTSIIEELMNKSIPKNIAQDVVNDLGKQIIS